MLPTVLRSFSLREKPNGFGLSGAPAQKKMDKGQYPLSAKRKCHTNIPAANILTLLPAAGARKGGFLKKAPFQSPKNFSATAAGNWWRIPAAHPTPIEKVLQGVWGALAGKRPPQKRPPQKRLPTKAGCRRARRSGEFRCPRGSTAPPRYAHSRESACISATARSPRRW